MVCECASHIHVRMRNKLQLYAYVTVICGRILHMYKQYKIIPASILYKSIAGRYRPVSYPDGPITARYRFIKNAYWVHIL